LIILLQVLLFNNIQLSESGISPFFYILFILILPFEIRDWALLLFAFFLGLSVDIFTDTGGVHASASVFTAFLRPLILRILSGREGYAPETSPGIAWYGFSWFLKYSFLLTFAHDLIYFLVLQFSFKDFFFVLEKVFFTSLLTVILILLSQFLVFRNH